MLCLVVNVELLLLTKKPFRGAFFIRACKLTLTLSIYLIPRHECMLIAMQIK